jgi:hypothetical protein
MIYSTTSGPKAAATAAWKSSPKGRLTKINNDNRESEVTTPAALTA